jgi:hypothetical protein
MIQRRIATCAFYLHTGYLLSLFFEPEYGGDMSLQTSVDFQRDTWP